MDAPTRTVATARRLRLEMTLPEVLLWTAIRGGRIGGFRFRRQHPIGPYVLDFYCAAEKFAVGVDGSAHDVPSSGLAPGCLPPEGGDLEPRGAVRPRSSRGTTRRTAAGPLR